MAVLQSTAQDCTQQRATQYSGVWHVSLTGECLRSCRQLLMLGATAATAATTASAKACRRGKGSKGSEEQSETVLTPLARLALPHSVSTGKGSKGSEEQLDTRSDTQSSKACRQSEARQREQAALGHRIHGVGVPQALQSLHERWPQQARVQRSALLLHSHSAVLTSSVRPAPGVPLPPALPQLALRVWRYGLHAFSACKRTAPTEETTNPQMSVAHNNPSPNLIHLHIHTQYTFFMYTHGLYAL